MLLFAESTTSVSMDHAVFASLLTFGVGVLVGLVGVTGGDAFRASCLEHELARKEIEHAKERRILESVCEKAHAGTIEVETRLAEILAAREEMAKTVAAAVNDYLLRSDGVKVREFVWESSDDDGGDE